MDRVRPSGRLLAPVRVPSSPHPNTNFVPCLPPRISSISGAPSGDREDAGQRSAGDRSRSGPRLLQPPLPGGKGDGRLAPRDRPVDSEHLHSTDTVQDGDCSLRLERCPRERSPHLPGLEGGVLSGARPSKFQEVSTLCVTGAVYQFKVLCFGLSTAPKVFTRVFAAVSAWAHSRGIRLLRYLDDWLVLASSETKARQHVQDLLLLCHDLGIVVNKEKSDLVPSRSASYLGMTIDTVAGKVSPSRARVEKFLRLAGNFVKMNSPPARQWEVLLGHLSSLEKLVPRGRLRLRSMRWQLKTSWSPEDDPPDLPVELTQEIREDLSWWTVESRLLQGVPFGTLPPGLLLFTDASCAGWGAHLLDQRTSGKWSEEEQMLHINLLEMKAVWLGLQSFQKIVTGHRVTVMCNNSTVVAYVSKQGGTHSRSMCELTSRLLKWTEDIDVHLEARYLPGQNNVLADLLSRRDQAIATEWTLHRQVAKALLSSWGSPSIDLFASRLNAQLPVYCSLVPDDQAALEDAFRHPWDNLDVYAFPPFALLGKVLSRVRQSRNCSMTLVAPLWADRDWFADLLLLLTHQPLALPLWDDVVHQPHNDLLHPGVPALKLHAWRLSSNSSESRAFREERRATCPDASVSPLRMSTSRSGLHFVIGVSASVPLIVDFFRHLV